MNDYQPLLDQARRLGEALALHPTVQRYFAAQHAARHDGAAQDFLRDHEELLERQSALRATGEALSAAEQTRLDQARAAVAGSATLAALAQAQADYVHMMREINAALDAPLAAARPPERRA